MADQELREKIAKEGATAYFQLWEDLSLQEQANWCIWAKEKIQPIFEEALPELSKEAGYVRLKPTAVREILDDCFPYLGKKDRRDEATYKICSKQAGGK